MAFSSVRGFLLVARIPCGYLEDFWPREKGMTTWNVLCGLGSDSEMDSKMALQEMAKTVQFYSTLALERTCGLVKVKYAAVKNTEARRNVGKIPAALRCGQRRVPAPNFTLFPGRNSKLRMDPTECADGEHACKQTPQAQVRVSSLEPQQRVGQKFQHSSFATVQSLILYHRTPQLNTNK